MAIKTRSMIYIILIEIGLIVIRQVKSDHPFAQTDCGKIVGKSFEVTTDDKKTKTVHEFVNIPYAIPPKGDLRWRAPVDLKEGGGCWNGTLEYNNRIIQCAQYLGRLVGVEDCLVLTVNTPLLNPKNPLPVSVWIHGGSMTYLHHRIKGYYPDAEFTASMNVVSVSINYRLNYFGFLSLEELWEDKPTGGFGNYGIMDQILALKWVQKNIGNFGGDPNQVTVFGESGGGTAVYGLLASSTGLSKGLFQKVIAMSGVPNYRITHTKANEIFRPIVNNTECTRSTKQAVAKCLRGLPTQTVQLLMKTKPMTDGRFDFPYNKPLDNFVPIEILDPMVVKYSLEQFMSHLQSSPDIHNLDILLGYTGQETFWETPLLPRWDSWKVLEDALKPKFDSFKKGSYQNILSAYRKKSAHKVSPKTIDPFYVYTTMICDVRVACTNARKVRLLSSYQPFRVMSYVMSQPIKLEIEGWIPQAFHASDAFALFGYKLSYGGMPKHQPSPNDMKLLRNIRSVFKRYFHSDSNLRKTYRSKTMEFWNNTVVTLPHSYHDTECKLLQDIGLSKYAWGNLGIYDD